MIEIPPALWAFDSHYPAISQQLRMTDAAALASLPDLGFVFLCFTNRCGSNLVAHALASDGRLNRGEELLNHDQVRAGAHGHASIQSYFNGLARHASRTGRFVMKAAPDHLLVLAASGILEAVLPRSTFVRISRRDRLGQAISFWIAAQTGQWASFQPPSGREPCYRRDDITWFMTDTEQRYAVMDALFALNGIVPVDVIYEDFVARPADALSAIGQAIGIADLAYVPENVFVSRQSGELNERWRQRYLAERGEA